MLYRNGHKIKLTPKAQKGWQGLTYDTIFITYAREDDHIL